ncbi:ABC transporter permease [Neobacillus drentensis]|uniref:ABC transporter permease n=1 Tax=Neobacillus drentensis TaxID=220684 RepID=UPI0030001171
MNYVLQIFKEQVSNLHLIFRLAMYEIKGKYQMHYLGALWQFLNPLIQVVIYWFVFGMGIRGGSPIGDTPFFVWLIIGLIPWFFIAPTINQGSNSIFVKLGLVSKMNFPISVLPTINIVSNAFSFIIMLVFLGLILVIYKINPGIYILQLPYYLFSLFIFLFAITFLTSTITIVVRDFHFMLQSVMRLMLYVTPVLWDTSALPNGIETVLKLNPLYYLVEGFRNSLISDVWFFSDILYTVYFWAITLLILFIGSVLHINLRHRFVDYL